MLFLQSETKIEPDLRLVPGSKTVGFAILKKREHENKTAGNWERKTATATFSMFTRSYFRVPFTTETGRPRIRRHARRLILAPDVNGLGHVALFVNQKGELTWSHSFSLLALLFAHQVVRVFYMALKGCNRKRSHRLTTFPRTKISPFWLTKNTILHFTWLGLATSGMWPREFTTMTQCLPAVTSVYHKTAILFIFLVVVEHSLAYFQKCHAAYRNLFPLFVWPRVLTFLVWQTKAREFAVYLSTWTK